ncbi:MAG TPA: glycoside hydrolase family 16 protein, partial [Prolixibacteraceae bacterium]
QLKKRSELAFFDQWEIALDENFTDHQLATKLWEPENYWGAKMAGYSFSQANELQSYNGLKNIVIRNEVLSIVTKAEKTEGKVWDPAIGILPKKFEFSSGILNTGNSFKFKEGIIEAKVKFKANKAITSALSLTGYQPFPQIDVFRSGDNSVGLGIIDLPGKENVKKLVQVKGLNYNNFHIFRLEIFANLAIWKINNYEVHREQVSKNMGDLFINFIGSLHQPVNGETLPHHFEIDWVRCLKKK